MSKILRISLFTCILVTWKRRRYNLRFTVPCS